MIKIIERKRLKFKDDYTYLSRNMIMDEHPQYILDSLLSYFKKEDLHPYPDMWKPYEILSKYLEVSQEQLLITRGVEGAFKHVFETLTNQGDSVGILTPTCEMYHVYAKVYGVDVIEIKGDVPDYKITVVETLKTSVPSKVWKVEGATPDEIKVVNICLDIDLADTPGANVEIKNMNGVLEVTASDSNETFFNLSCVYILVGPEQVMG